jgi:hypothetical protein
MKERYNLSPISRSEDASNPGKEKVGTTDEPNTVRSSESRNKKDKVRSTKCISVPPCNNDSNPENGRRKIDSVGNSDKTSLAEVTTPHTFESKRYLDRAIPPAMSSTKRKIRSQKISKPKDCPTTSVSTGDNTLVFGRSFVATGANDIRVSALQRELRVARKFQGDDYDMDDLEIANLLSTKLTASYDGRSFARDPNLTSNTVTPSPNPLTTASGRHGVGLPASTGTKEQYSFSEPLQSMVNSPSVSFLKWCQT